MSRKNYFKTIEEAVEYLNTLPDDEVDDDCFEMDIIPPDPDQNSDDENIDDNLLVNELRNADLEITRDLHDVAGTIEIPIQETDENISIEVSNSSEITSKENEQRKIIEHNSVYSDCKLEAKVPEAKWKIKGNNRLDPLPNMKHFIEEREKNQHRQIGEMREKLYGLNPIEIFNLYADAIVEHIHKQSLTYAAQKNEHGFLLTQHDIRAFLGILIFSGYHKLPRENMYWEKSPDCSTSIVSNTMSRNRYKEIKKYIHFNDNSQIEKDDKYFKVRPLYDILNNSLNQFGVMSQQLTIDERMVKYFGRNSLKMYMKGKPVRFGYKLWMLCTFDGYPLKIIPYQGRSEAKDIPLSHRVVTSLLDIVKNPAEHTVYMDNFFSSHTLFVGLKEKGFFATGTVRAGRIAKCPLLPISECSKKPRGFMTRAFDCKNCISVVQWNDTKPVTVISNFEQTLSTVYVSRRSKGQVCSVPIPESIKSYNKYKNGVDLFDGLMSAYDISIKGKKWYWTLFTNVVDTIIIASWKAYQFAECGNDDLLTFRRG